MPRKIAGREMIRIDALIVAISMPSVVFDSTAHRCGRRPGGVAGAPPSARRSADVVLMALPAA
jgi:hypothetical protein